MPSITATRRLALAGLALLLAGPAAGETAAARFAALRGTCGSDLACLEAGVRDVFGAGARLEAVAHPDTDTIRWVTSRRSLVGALRLDDGGFWLRLDRFGRRAVQELAAALDAAGGAPLLLDLRHNRGGDLLRMLAVAGLLAGPQEAALRLVGETGSRELAIPGNAVPAGRLTVLVGPATASSAELLAALLRRHAGATLLGAPTAGKDRLTRVVPLDRDWRLLLPGERLELPGERLAGGLVPDRPIPERLARQLDTPLAPGG